MTSLSRCLGLIAQLLLLCEESPNWGSRHGTIRFFSFSNLAMCLTQQFSGEIRASLWLRRRIYTSGATARWLDGGFL